MKPWVKTILMIVACIVVVNVLIFLIAFGIVYLGWR